jgi:hypothetical protein
VLVLPTAMQLFAAAQDTPVSSGFFGPFTLITDQFLPFHSSANPVWL